MKKRTFRYALPVLLFIVISIVISACSKTEAFSPVFLVGPNGNYSGFSDITESLTIDKAASMGYVAIDGQRIAENSDIWEDFVKDSSKGNNSSVRLVYFYTNSSVYVIDIFYNNEKYYLFDNSVEQQNTDGFNYLLKLEGTFGIPAKQTIAFILADNESITFDQYMTSMLSSSMDVIQAVQPNRLIMFLLPES